MTIEWNIILWCCITVATLLVAFVIVYYIMSARMMKKRRQQVLDINENLVPGKKIMFAGIIGTIKEVNGELLSVEVSKGIILEVSRFAVTNIID